MNKHVLLLCAFCGCGIFRVNAMEGWKPGSYGSPEGPSPLRRLTAAIERKDDVEALVLVEVILRPELGGSMDCFDHDDLKNKLARDPRYLEMATKYGCKKAEAKLLEARVVSAK